MKAEKKAKNEAVDTTSILSNVLFVLYLLVGYSYLIEFESESFQWLYFSVLNVASLVFFIYEKKYKMRFSKIEKLFFSAGIGLLLISFISITKAIYATESLVHISRFINILVAIYCLLVIVKEKPKYFFELTCKVFLVILIYDSFLALKYFIGNSRVPRTADFFRDFDHHQGNINLYTASLITKLPFVFYLFSHNNKIWKFLSYLAVPMVVIALFFSGSRTALLSLFLGFVVFTVFNTYQFVKDKKPGNLLPPALMVMSILLSVFLFKNVNKLNKRQSNSLSLIAATKGKNYLKVENLKKQNPKLAVSSLNLKEDTDNLNGIEKIIQEKGSGRYNIWKTAIDLFKNNFLMGVGYGNYKLAPKPEYYKKKYRRKGLNFTKRVHNDFLEKFTELGFFGGILYVSLFGILFYGLYRQFRTSHADEKLIVVILLVSLLIYTSDAFFNFPIERANVSLSFILVAAFILVLSKPDKKDVNQVLKKPVVKYILLFVTTATLVSNYLVYKSYKLNQYVAGDVRAQNFKGSQFTFEYLQSKAGRYPELTFNAIHKDYFSLFFHQEPRNIENELQFINSIPKKTFLDSLLFFEAKAKVFYRDVNRYKDSIKYFSMENIKKRPALKSSIVLMKDMLTREKDTAKLLELYHFITKNNPKDSETWLNKIALIHKKNRDKDLAIAMLDTALFYNKNNFDIINNRIKFVKSKSASKTQNKEYALVTKYFKERNFKEAKKVLEKIVLKSPNDFTSVRNLGIVEMNLGNYERAISLLTTVIDMSGFSDGKAEFCRGFSHEKLKQYELSKKDYQESRKKGFPQAMALKESQYK